MPAKPQVSIVLEKEERKQMMVDIERIGFFKDYRRRFENQMEMGARAANMIADPSPRDDVSNIHIGVARMISEVAIGAMNDGRPFFGFRPGTPADHSKKTFWESAISHIMDVSNFDTKQTMFLTDYTYLNMGIYEVVPQFPVRTLRMPVADGKFKEVTKRDYRRGKVEIRHRNPFEVWLDPSAPNTQEVKAVYDEQYMTANDFKLRYANAVVFDMKGKKVPRYKNISHVRPGYDLGVSGNDLMYRESSTKDRIVVGKIQDENNDILAEYANGVPIFDGALQMKELEDGRRSIGMNALGVHSFCFAPNEFQYDDNLRTHSLYPMGLPYTMRGFSSLYQALTNMQIDNIRLANTMAISYKPFDGTSQLDLDARDYYSGDFIDGEIGVHQFGQTRTGEFQAMMQIVDNWSIYLTGVNFKQLFGDSSRTAFELSQRIRAQNRRFEHKLRVMENGCFKKLGQLTLSGAMSELTVADYEAINQKDVKKFMKKIKAGEMTGEDFEMIGGKITGRKVRTMIRVNGINGSVFSEKFSPSSNQKRTFAGAGDDTLVLSKTKGVTSSLIPAAPQYLWSQEYIEHGGVPDVYAKGARMLADDRDLKFAKVNSTMLLARERAAEDPSGTQFDLAKIERQYIHSADIPEEDVMKDKSSPTSDLKKEIDEAQKIALSQFKDVDTSINNQRPNIGGAIPVPQGIVPGQPPSLGQAEKAFTSPIG